MDPSDCFSSKYFIGIQCSRHSNLLSLTTHVKVSCLKIQNYHLRDLSQSLQNTHNRILPSQPKFLIDSNQYLCISIFFIAFFSILDDVNIVEQSGMDQGLGKSACFYLLLHFKNQTALRLCGIEVEMAP